MPPPSISMPSTKITLPPDLDLDDLRSVTDEFVEPEDPHTPLIWMTVLTQLGLGGLVSILGLDLLRVYASHLFTESIAESIAWLAAAVLATTAVSLGASTLHLGRPAYAFRAIRNWRTSWLSREVIGLSVFAKLGLGYGLILFAAEVPTPVPVSLLPGNSLRLLLGFAAVAAGIVGVYASARLYRVPARPMWNLRKTTVDFFVVAAILGPSAVVVATTFQSALAAADSFASPLAISQVAAALSALAMMAFAAVHAASVNSWSNSECFELSASARLYLEELATIRWIRNGLAAPGVVALSVVAAGYPTALTNAVMAAIGSAIGFLSMLSYCLLQRYLFFVTVVSTKIAGNFIVEAHRALRA